jgi:hypothetical protein
LVEIVNDPAVPSVKSATFGVVNEGGGPTGPRESPPVKLATASASDVHEPAGSFKEMEPSSPECAKSPLPTSPESVSWVVFAGTVSMTKDIVECLPLLQLIVSLPFAVDPTPSANERQLSGWANLATPVTVPEVTPPSTQPATSPEILTTAGTTEELVAGGRPGEKDTFPVKVRHDDCVGLGATALSVEGLVTSMTPATRLATTSA